MDQIAVPLMNLIAALVSAGPWGLAAAVLVGLFSVFIWWRISRLIKDAAQRETERGRVEDQAKNDTDNANAEKDANAAKEEIDKIIGKGDN